MWPEAIAVPAGRRASGELVVPPSKSVTNRLCNLALIAWKPVVLVRPLVSDDIRRFREVLTRLGFEVAEKDGGVDGGELALSPPDRPHSEVRLDCGDSGTLLRFLVAALTSASSVAISSRYRPQDSAVGAYSSAQPSARSSGSSNSVTKSPRASGLAP